MARWLNGAASVEWLMEHPSWYEWADITQLGYEEGIAERRRLEAEGYSA